MRKLVDKIKSIPIEARASVAYTICSILQQGVSFITLPLFTRLLTTEEYGQYSLYSSWAAIIAIFITLNLPYGSFMTAMVKYREERDRYIASIQGIFLLLGGIFLVIYLPFQFLWNKLFDLPTAIILIMVVEIIANAALQCWTGRKRYEFKYISVIIVTILVSIVAPVTAYIFVINSGQKGFARIIGYALINILFGGYLLLYNFVKGKTAYSKEFWKYALSFNLPLIVYYLSQVAFNQTDRIMINHYCGTGKVALYGVAHSLGMLLTFVLNAINNSYVPWFYEKISDGKQRDNRKIACYIAVLMAFLLMGVVSLAPEIILLLAGKAYSEAVWIVPPVALSVLLLFYAQLFINVEFYYEEKKLLIYASVGAAIVNIILNSILIPNISYIAAGYTTMISYILFAVSNYLAMKRVLKKHNKENDMYHMGGLILTFIGFMILCMLAMSLYQLPMFRYGIIAAVLLGVVLNYKRIIKILKDFR